ncbi:1675_t:CDS:2, partial [Racocetra fulgida]
ETNIPINKSFSSQISEITSIPTKHKIEKSKEGRPRMPIWNDYDEGEEDGHGHFEAKAHLALHYKGSVPDNIRRKWLIEVAKRGKKVNDKDKEIYSGKKAKTSIAKDEYSHLQDLAKTMFAIIPSQASCEQNFFILKWFSKGRHTQLQVSILENLLDPIFGTNNNYQEEITLIDKKETNMKFECTFLVQDALGDSDLYD